MALAEAVQELEAALKKERAKSSSLRDALESPTGKRDTEAPSPAEPWSPEAAPLPLPDPRHRVSCATDCAAFQRTQCLGAQCI